MPLISLNNEPVHTVERAGTGRVRLKSNNHAAVFTIEQVRKIGEDRNFAFTTKGFVPEAAPKPAPINPISRALAGAGL